MSEPIMEYTIDENPVDDGVPSSAQVPSPPRLHLGGGGDVKRFANVLYLLIKAVNPGVVFTKAYPESVIDKVYKGDSRVPTLNPTITWRVTARTNASLNNAPFTGRVQKRPRYKEGGVEDPTNTQNLVSVFEMGYDNEIRFDIFTEDREEAEDLAEWFTDLIELFRGYFEECGFQHMFFLRRVSDQHPEKMAISYNVITLYYYVRTARYYQKTTTRIQEITVKLLAIVNDEEKMQKFLDGTLQDELFSN